MTLTKEFIGWNPDGTPHIKYTYTGAADGGEDGEVLMTGTATGKVTTNDGTEYDVTPGVIETQPGHSAEVALIIEYGRPVTADEVAARQTMTSEDLKAHLAQNAEAAPVDVPAAPEVTVDQAAVPPEEVRSENG